MVEALNTKRLCRYNIKLLPIRHLPHIISALLLYQILRQMSISFRKLFYFPRKLVNRPFADEVRIVFAVFPLADGVRPNAHRYRKIRLCQLGGLPYALDERSVGFVALNFHFCSFLLLCKIQSLVENGIFSYNPHHHISRL